MVHGGLSPSIQSIDQIRAIDRVVEVDSISFVVVVVWNGLKWSALFFVCIDIVVAFHCIPYSYSLHPLCIHLN